MFLALQNLVVWDIFPALEKARILNKFLLFFR